MAPDDRWLAPERDEATRLLPLGPPSWAARGLAGVLVLLFAAAILAAVLVRISETVTSPFVLVPLRGTDPVRAARAGVVSEVHAAAGQAVRADQPMVVIRAPAIGDLSAERRALDTQRVGDTERLANEQRKYDSQRLADDQEMRRLQERAAHLTRRLEQHRALRPVQQARYRATLDIQQNEMDIIGREIEFKRQQHTMLAELATRSEKSHREGAISWLEYNNRRLEATKLAVDLAQLDRQLDSARLRVSQLHADHERQESEWTTTTTQLETDQRDTLAAMDKLRHEGEARRTAYRELERSLREAVQKAGIRIDAITAQLVQGQGAELTVAAPCAGTVLRVDVQRAGAVVQEGQTLAEVACAGSGLHAEMTLPNASVARIKPGQPVKLLYDAFPYQRHGVRQGVVRWVTPAGLAGKDGPTFRAFAEIDTAAISVDGQPRALLAGMGGKAHIVVGQRRLISYAFEPLRQIKENLSTPDVPR